MSRELQLTLDFFWIVEWLSYLRCAIYNRVPRVLSTILVSYLITSLALPKCRNLYVNGIRINIK